MGDKRELMFVVSLWLAGGYASYLLLSNSRFANSLAVFKTIFVIAGGAFIGVAFIFALALMVAVTTWMSNAIRGRKRVKKNSDH